MPQACHGALEMGSGPARASCKSGFDRLRSFTPHYNDIRDARWRSRRAAPPTLWPNCRLGDRGLRSELGVGDEKEFLRVQVAAASCRDENSLRLRRTAHLCRLNARAVSTRRRRLLAAGR